MIVLLGGLIFFHEFGHYIIAKSFGVRVEVFSLGFGKKLFRKTWGDTEYCLSVFPLGGYVKLMGDDPYKEVPAAEAHRAFSTQKLYKRFLIVAAGPLFNLLLGFLLMMVIFAIGRPVPGTKIGTVQYESLAWESGIRAKDRILAINDTQLKTWQELEDYLKTRGGQTATVKLDRSGTLIETSVPISWINSRNIFGKEEKVGGIAGISEMPLASVVGISDPQSNAAKAGLKTGDQVTKIGTVPIQNYDSINEVLETEWKAKQPLTFSIVRNDSDELSFSVVLPESTPPKLPFGYAERLGIYPPDVFIRSISKDSPAEKAGLQPGDRIVSLGGQPVYSFENIVDHVQSKGKAGEPVVVTLERSGKTITLPITAEETTFPDPITQQPVKKFLLGFSPQTVVNAPETVDLIIREPIPLITRAFSETWDMADKIVMSLVKLLTGDISFKHLGGPVMIASIAGKSLDAGATSFLYTMAFISINLFLLNLFPIPILDGGHLLFFSIEAIKGKPVSIKTMELANQIGLVLILMLVGLTLYNDIARMVTH